MIKNYFKIAWRNLWRNKVFSFINIFSLIIGLACCLMIALYIQHEVSYDNFQKKGNRIARVIMEYKFGGGEFKKGNFTSVRVASVFKRNFPEVEAAVKMVQTEKVVSYKEKLLNEKRFMFADSTFFDVFSFKLLQGNTQKVLSAPNEVVVTETTAKKYFGNENAVGKTLRVGTDTNLYQVTGVVQDCPSNSQIKFDFLASFSSLAITHEYELSYWNANFTTFLLLENKKAISTLQAKLPAFMKKEMAGDEATINFYLEPFNTIHLYSPFDSFEPNNNITYIYILSVIALLTLLIACFTYINLSTARSIERAKEVGVRKVIGAGKGQIFWQFIAESSALCVLSVVLAILVAMLVLPYFNQLTNKHFQANSLLTFSFLGFVFLIVIGVSFSAGSYPALILSGYKPVRVLKGAFKNIKSAQWLSKSLIVVQFFISVLLILSTIIIQQQLSFIQHKKLGYNRQHVLVLTTGYQMKTDLLLLKQQLKENRDVSNVSRCYSTPVEIAGGYNMRSSVMPENEQVAVTANPVDEEFVPATGLQLIAGSNLSEQDIKDVTGDQKQKLFHFILNESAAAQLGWTPQQAIGKKMFLDASRPGFVKGVVKDFNFESLHKAIKPLVLFSAQEGRQLLVKLSGHNLAPTISSIQTKWKDLVPERPFEYRFLDDDYNKLYDSELRIGKVMKLFSTIAIVLACIGLFGLSAHAAQQRIKEIGVRKVLGASVANIVFILSKDFIKLAAVAIIVAFPVGWWAMHNWLQNYQYRVSIHWWLFVVTGLAAMAIVFFTVSFQAIKAAISNPVKSLRTE